MSRAVVAPARSYHVKRILLIGLAVSIVLGAALSWWILGVMAGRRLERAETVADRTDPGWRLNDLIAAREMIPDEENSALRVLEILGQIPKSWPPLSKPITSLDLSQTPSGGRDLLSQIGAVPPHERLDLWLTAALRDELGKYLEAVRQARMVADLDGGRYPLTIAPNAWNTLLTHAQNTRSVDRLLKADAFLRAHDGDFDGALQSCRAMIQTGRSLGDEPFAISQLVRVVLVNDGIHTMERILAQGEASDEALAKVEALLLDELRWPMLLVAMRGERATMNDIVEKLASGQIPFSSVAGTLGATGLTKIPLSASYYRYNQALILEQLNQAVEISKRPDAELIDAWTEWNSRAQVRGSFLMQLMQGLKQVMSPSGSAMAQAHLRHRAMTSMAIAMVAAERERLATGQMPTDLDFLQERPELAGVRDPFTGEPLRYTTDETGLIIYSVGEDREDNHARFHPRRASVFGFDLGLKLVAPEFRGQPPRNELPKDVFQSEPKIL